MLSIALGFVLVFGVPIASFGAFSVLPSRPEYVFGILGETGRFTGLPMILYGLRMPNDAPEAG